MYAATADANEELTAISWEDACFYKQHRVLLTFTHGFAWITLWEIFQCVSLPLRV
jgi:hypothetical protein